MGHWAVSEGRYHAEESGGMNEDQWLRNLAGKMGLEIVGGDLREAIELEIDRLIGVQARWEKACDLARVHCAPYVDIGESYIFSGIPRMAAKAKGHSQ